MKKLIHYLKWAILSLPLLLNISCKKVPVIIGPPVPCYSCPCTTCPVFNIGDNALGGKVAYIFQPLEPGWGPIRQTGLIAAISDQSTGTDWGCAGTSIYDADSTALYAGSKNTINITAGCSAPGIAARICADLDLAGYSDWHLPSKDELNKLYLNRAIIGGFVNKTYWSSSQNSNGNAWNQNFSNGTQNDSSKNKMYYVRAVRYY